MPLPLVTARSSRGGAFAAAPAKPAAASGGVTRQSDLVHWWKFDGDGTDTIGDADLTLYNDAACQTSVKKFGTHALELDGTSDYAATGDGDVTALASAYTFSFWIRLTSTAGTLPGTVGFYINTSRANATAVEILQHGGVFRYYHAADVDQSLTSGTTASINNWFFLAQTWDGSTVKYWWADDGGGDASVTEKGNDTINNVQAGIDTLFVGRSAYSYSKQGYYDDLRLYNVALSESELNEVYNGGDGDF